MIRRRLSGLRQNRWPITAHSPVLPMAEHVRHLRSFPIGNCHPAIDCRICTMLDEIWSQAIHSREFGGDQRTGPYRGEIMHAKTRRRDYRDRPVLPDRADSPAGPRAAETANDQAAGQALRAAAGRTAALLRRLREPAAIVPGLIWNAAETT